MPDDWGARGGFRKVTITLPPEVYDTLVQEAARRKSAGDPNHLLSAIAREWFAQRQPLLPIERVELSLYRAIEASTRDGREHYYLQNLPALHQEVGTADVRTLVELIVDITARGWLHVEKYSKQEGKYVPLQQWHDTDMFFYQPGDVRVRATIPGVRRKEALASKEPNNRGV